MTRYAAPNGDREWDAALQSVGRLDFDPTVLYELLMQETDPAVFPQRLAEARAAVEARQAILQRALIATVASDASCRRTRSNPSHGQPARVTATNPIRRRISLVDGDGLISGRDLGAALQAEGLAPVGRLELTTLMAHADTNQDGYIDRREFTKWLTSSSPSNEAVVRTALGRMRTLLDARYHTMGAAFQALGAARPHCHLERSDLQRVLTGAGIHLPEDDMDALVRRFDPDGTGRITHANFIRAFAP